jgi:hypothetical protein
MVIRMNPAHDVQNPPGQVDDKNMNTKRDYDWDDSSCTTDWDDSGCSEYDDGYYSDDIPGTEDTEE